MLLAMDAANPDLLVGRRPTTNVPSQALVLINSPDVNQWALATAGRIVEAANDFDDRLQLAFELCLQRNPMPQDRRIATRFFADRRDSLEAWHPYVAAIFAATEFRLLD
jgi:hypothetical protein